VAGILKSIQKKQHNTPSSSLVEEPIASIIRSSSGSIDRNKAEAEKLLAELVEESTPAQKSNIRGGTRLVKRHQIIQSSGGEVFIKDNSLPDWVKPVSKFPSNLENSLLLAIRKLNHLLLERGSIPKDLEEFVVKIITDISNAGDTKLGWKEADLLKKEILSVFSSYGPLEILFADTATTEIFIDSYKSIKVKRKGVVIETPFSFRHPEEYELFTSAILAQTGSILSRTHPILDCFIDGQSLVNAVHSSVAGDTRITIRIPRAQKVSFYELLQSKTLPATLAAWLAEVISQGEANILIVGQNSAAKTMLTSALASEVGSDERVITVEELPEIQASTTNLEKLVARPGTVSNGSAVSLAELVRAAVRRHPKRIILGELRDEESREYLRALESGLRGCIASITGEYPEDGMWRLLDLLTPWEHTPQFSLMRRIVRSVHLIISLQNFDDKPCLVEIAEVMPLKGMDFQVMPIVQLDSINEGKRVWRIVADDSYWLRRIAERGSGLRSGPALLPLNKS